MKAIIVYTIDNCSYCEAAKALLIKKNLSFQEKNITNDDTERKALIERTGHRTMPQIFIDDEFVGGYTELKIFLNK